MQEVMPEKQTIVITVLCTPYKDHSDKHHVGTPDQTIDDRVATAAQYGVPVLMDLRHGIAETPPFQLRLDNMDLYPPKMMRLRNEYIRFAPHKVLSSPTEDVTPEEIQDPKFQQRVFSMIPIMYFARGIGLAAPQIGWNKRVFVMDAWFYPVLGEPRDKIKPKIFFNPKIVDTRDGMHKSEGCLSVPGYQCAPYRHENVIVEYLNHKGETVTDTFSGREAHIIQHEIDHLNGKTLLDTIPKGVRRTMYIEKVRKIEKLRSRRARRSHGR